MGIVAIGDVHGCAETLRVLLDTLDPQVGDHYIFVGDYIDRGPNSRAVIDTLFTLQELVRCTFLRGNHEELMLNYIDHGEFELWRANGGINTLNSYRSSDGIIKIPERHIRFIRETKLYYDSGDFFFVHAGLRPDLTIDENVRLDDENVFLWDRHHLESRDVKWEKPVVCGHTPHSEPINLDKLILIDTGCVYYSHQPMGTLTAVRLPEREFVSVEYVG